jgi:hypothetical protein
MDRRRTDDAGRLTGRVAHAYARAMRTTAAALVCFLTVAVGCATADVPELAAGGQRLRTGKSDPDPGMRELGPIEAINGSGCGGFGAKGTYEGALNELKNRGAAMGADYVQIFTMTEPHRTASCYDDEFTIRGMAFKASAAPRARPRRAPVATPAADDSDGEESAARTCEPVCSPGFVCRDGVCEPVCNPPCEKGETCTRKRVCEPTPPGA